MQHRRENMNNKCQHCGGHIAFATEQAGQNVVCPHCGNETLMEIPPQTSLNFFVWQNEQQQGPFDQETIQRKISKGQITGETLLCPEDGGLDWTPAKELFFQDLPPAIFQPESVVETRINPFQFLSYRRDEASEDSLVEIRLTSGTELKIKAIRFFNLQTLTIIDAKKMEAREKNQGVSTGLGSFGSLGWVLASSVVIGAVEGVLSSGAAAQGANLQVEASRMETALLNEGVFLPVGMVKNIEHPFPEKWIAQGSKKDLRKGMDKLVATIFAHDGNDFVTVQTDDGSVRSIRWSTVESYAYRT
ncbi:MAG TPA: hypothetical protein DCQ92_03360 [Verrucomicrobia subdivision 3 bacterium]|nr:hypothetical protein [Limisphaerales bacterium]